MSETLALEIDVNGFIGRRIRRRRRLMDMTQQELGDACGVTFQQVQKYECAYTRVSVEMLWRLARALEVDISYFFVGLSPGTEPQAAATPCADPLVPIGDPTGLRLA